MKPYYCILGLLPLAFGQGSLPPPILPTTVPAYRTPWCGGSGEIISPYPPCPARQRCVNANDGTPEVVQGICVPDDEWPVIRRCGGSEETEDLVVCPEGQTCHMDAFMVWSPHGLYGVCVDGIESPSATTTTSKTSMSKSSAAWTGTTTTGSDTKPSRVSVTVTISVRVNSTTAAVESANTTKVAGSTASGPVHTSSLDLVTEFSCPSTATSSAKSKNPKAPLYPTTANSTARPPIHLHARGTSPPPPALATTNKTTLATVAIAALTPRPPSFFHTCAGRAKHLLCPLTHDCTPFPRNAYRCTPWTHPPSPPSPPIPARAFRAAPSSSQCGRRHPDDTPTYCPAGQHCVLPPHSNSSPLPQLLRGICVEEERATAATAATATAVEQGQRHHDRAGRLHPRKDPVRCGRLSYLGIYEKSCPPGQECVDDFLSFASWRGGYSRICLERLEPGGVGGEGDGGGE